MEAVDGVRSRILLALLGSLVVLGSLSVVVPRQASGAAGEVDRIIVGSGENQCPAAVAVDGDGLLVAASTSVSDSVSVISVRRWAPGSGWGSPQAVSAPDVGACVRLWAVSDGGTAVVGWFAVLADGSAAIQAAVRSGKGSPFRPATSVVTVTKEQQSDEALEFPYFIEAPVIVGGSILLAWSTLVSPEDIGSQMWAAQWQSGAWSPPALVVDAGTGGKVLLMGLVATDSGALAVGADDRGDSTFGMGWTPSSGWSPRQASPWPGESCDGSPAVMSTARRAVLMTICGPADARRAWARDWSGQEWDAWAPVSPEFRGEATAPLFEAGSDGAIAIAYAGNRRQGEYWLRVAISRAPGSWGRPVQVGTSRDAIRSVLLALAGTDAVVAWDAKDGKDRPGRVPYPERTMARVLRDGRTLTPARALGDGIGWNGSAAGTPSGAVLAWNSPGQSDYRGDDRLVAATWAAASGWGDPVVAGPGPYGDITTAASAQGSFVAWQTQARAYAALVGTR